ncbi:MAG: hypothetical protein EOP86_21800 [Verrucomicrobiaceae bacterium]|nr:MAG: hypothetical protein EOP86_21800 [Verrucomicrobiaceae bacterium]
MFYLHSFKRPAMLFLLTGTLSATASIAIVDVYPPGDTGSFEEEHGNGMIGWNFKIKKPLVVTQVGWYDAGGDGLAEGLGNMWRVGLWQDPTGGDFAPGTAAVQLLGSNGNGIFIPPGTSAELQDVWRVVTLPAPLTLQPGSYQIAGLDSFERTDPILFVSGQKSNELVESGTFFWSAFSAGTFTYSSEYYLAYGVELGPMLFTVPEPSGQILIVLGMIIVLRRRSRG